ncbi:carbohydrate sulfotransferase 7 [Carcharodon carcharias]|uniref:carbohydrate sulfotransferase 7 n=1 Tax=Carcharodon carcharias TaxID=13397 RepID=UPI001B7F4CE8|nr:carbohydrate sulfotransferase 7 [Carcharodon carcharias]
MKLLWSRCLIVIVIYSSLLLAVSYFLDCHNKLPAAAERLFPRECSDTSAPMPWEEVGAGFGAGGNWTAGGRGRQHVYLHATWRTGSSFAGELFNQHPAVFYLYEPMWLMWQALYPGDAESLQGAVRDMLRSLFRCDFSVLRLYSAAAPLTTRTVFGWRNNKVICSAPLCSAYSKERVELVEGGVCEKQCAARDIQELERECRRYDVMVIKDVRVLDAGVLFPLMQDPALNLKVVQLVRDPRAVHNSRMKSKQSLVKESIQVLRSKSRSDRDKGFWISNRAQRADTYVAKALEVICEAWTKDQVLVRRSPAWLRSRYLTIRYEDLVLEPLGGLRTLYDFANLTVTPATENYVLNMTRGAGYSSDKPFLISSRDAKEAVSAWKTRLSLWQIQQVEQSCQTAMEMLGYRPNGVDNT